MHDSVQSKWITAFAARNDPERIRLRLTLSFSAFYFAVFVSALLLCRYTLVSTLPSLKVLCETLFTSPFEKCTIAREYVRVILKTSRREFILLAVLTLAGMTYFPKAVANAALAAHALLFGTVAYNTLSAILAGNITHPHANLVFFVYFFSQLAQAAILLSSAAETVCFSYEYRDAGRALRSHRDSIAAHFVIRAVSHAGMLLIVQTGMAILLDLLQR